MIVYESDLKNMAIDAMRNCMNYLAIVDIAKAHRYYGEAIAYENMLLDEGIDLEVENEHYREMKELYFERTV